MMDDRLRFAVAVREFRRELANAISPDPATGPDPVVDAMVETIEGLGILIDELRRDNAGKDVTIAALNQQVAIRDKAIADMTAILERGF